MAVQFPQRDIAAQTAAYQDYAANTLYPYSYPFRLLASGATPGTAYPNTSPTGGWKYNTIAFQADNNMAISNVEISVTSYLLTVGVSIPDQFTICLSYSPVFNATPLVITSGAPTVSIPTIPGDNGNEIIRYTWSQVTDVVTNGTAVFTGTLYERFEPYNYLLKYNQYLYIHIAASSGSLTAVVDIVGDVILHTLPTGLKI